jgi:hypothetical protein
MMTEPARWPAPANVVSPPQNPVAMNRPHSGERAVSDEKSAMVARGKFTSISFASRRQQAMDCLLVVIRLSFVP